MAALKISATKNTPVHTNPNETNFAFSTEVSSSGGNR
jgi:hypothetical protein